MKMSIEEFISRQKEFEGHKARFKVKVNNGSVKYFEILVNDEFCNPNGEMFQVLEVEIMRKDHTVIYTSANEYYKWIKHNPIEFVERYSGIKLKWYEKIILRNDIQKVIRKYTNDY